MTCLQYQRNFSLYTLQILFFEPYRFLVVWLRWFCSDIFLNFLILYSDSNCLLILPSSLLTLFSPSFLPSVTFLSFLFLFYLTSLSLFILFLLFSQGVGDLLLNIPITAECVVSPLRLAVREMSFGDCYIRHPYEMELTLTRYVLVLLMTYLHPYIPIKISVTIHLFCN